MWVWRRSPRAARLSLSGSVSGPRSALCQILIFADEALGSRYLLIYYFLLRYVFWAICLWFFVIYLRQSIFYETYIHFLIRYMRTILIFLSICVHFRITLNVGVTCDTLMIRDAVWGLAGGCRAGRGRGGGGGGRDKRSPQHHAT